VVLDRAEILTFIKAAVAITTTVLAWAEPLTLAVQHHPDTHKVEILPTIIKGMLLPEQAALADTFTATADQTVVQVS
jgi:hypothetical protein